MVSLASFLEGQVNQACFEMRFQSQVKVENAPNGMQSK